MLTFRKMIIKQLITSSKHFPEFRNLCRCGLLSIVNSRNSYAVTNRLFSDQADVSRESVSYQAGSVLGNVKHNLAHYMAQGLSSKNLYESCADAVSYKEFFIDVLRHEEQNLIHLFISEWEVTIKACKMPDTFQSWFYVMQLHLWMLLVRLRVEGRSGKRISYKMVEIMWQDVEERMKLIGVEDTTERRETMSGYAQQFFGLIVAYDEGLLGHDRVLASALWRNLFYNKHDTDAEALANLVGYVRKQIQHLEHQNTDDLLLHGQVNWLPLHEADDEKEGIEYPTSALG